MSARTKGKLLGLLAGVFGPWLLACVIVLPLRWVGIEAGGVAVLANFSWFLTIPAGMVIGARMGERSAGS